MDSSAQLGFIQYFSVPFLARFPYTAKLKHQATFAGYREGLKHCYFPIAHQKKKKVSFSVTPPTLTMQRTTLTWWTGYKGDSKLTKLALWISTESGFDLAKTLLKKVADGLGTGQTKKSKKENLLNAGQLEKNISPHCTAMPSKERQIKVPLPLNNVNPKTQWHCCNYVRLALLSCLSCFVLFRRWWTLRGKNWDEFLSILLSAASWGGANSCSGAAMYK